MQKPKRVAAVHDISAFGRCALSVIIPTISAMGVQVCPVPTAVLSTHTGGFSDIAAVPCHDFPAMADRHWQQYHIDLDCIYSGYLGDRSQIEQIISFKRGHEDALLIVDPVMGDDGAVYHGIAPELTYDMLKLCKAADLITPNTTEMALLLGIPYCDRALSRKQAVKNLQALSFGGQTDVIITGCPIEDLGICNIGLTKDEPPFCVPCHYIGGAYPGTGDIFTSVVTGGLMTGLSLIKAAKLATLFTEKCIALTVDSGEPERDGVFLEYALPMLFHPEFDREAVEL